MAEDKLRLLHEAYQSNVETVLRAARKLREGLRPVDDDDKAFVTSESGPFTKVPWEALCLEHAHELLLHTDVMLFGDRPHYVEVVKVEVDPAGDEGDDVDDVVQLSDLPPEILVKALVKHGVTEEQLRGVARLLRGDQTMLSAENKVTYAVCSKLKPGCKGVDVFLTSGGRDACWQTCVQKANQFVGLAAARRLLKQHGEPPDDGHLAPVLVKVVHVSTVKVEDTE